MPRRVRDGGGHQDEHETEFEGGGLAGRRAARAGAAMGVMAGTAGAQMIYKNMPKARQLDGAEGFECCGTSSFGGEVTFAGTNRRSPTITAGLLSFACQEGSDQTCKTKKAATFTWPITLEITNRERVTKWVRSSRG